MKSTLGSLAVLTLALVSGEIAVLTLWRCNPDAAGGDLGCYIGRGFMLVAFGGSSSLAALILGVIACLATRETRRWAWYVSAHGVGCGCAHPPPAQRQRALFWVYDPG
jgi:hypothetical protein